MRTQTKAAVAALGLAGLLLAGAASANTTTTLFGTDVSYTFDTTQPDFSLFGTPAVSGNSLSFAPGSFIASGDTATTAMITITVTAKEGYFLSGFQLTEMGAYTLPSSEDFVGVGGVFEALDIEGTTGNYLSSPLIGPLPSVGTDVAWQAGASLAIPASGWGGVDGLVTSVSLTIDNQLFAFGAASIWKDEIIVEAIATPVPEAETYAMMLAGLGLVGFMARRRRAQHVEAGQRG